MILIAPQRGSQRAARENALFAVKDVLRKPVHTGGQVDSRRDGAGITQFVAELILLCAYATVKKNLWQAIDVRETHVIEITPGEDVRDPAVAEGHFPVRL